MTKEKEKSPDEENRSEKAEKVTKEKKEETPKDKTQKGALKDKKTKTAPKVKEGKETKTKQEKPSKGKATKETPVPKEAEEKTSEESKGTPEKSTEKGKDGDRRYQETFFDKEAWEPRTKLGHLVKDGKLKTIGEVIRCGLPLKEVEIVDALMPDMAEEILKVGRVQRVTDSGRRMRFRVVTVVGNNNGYVGVGHAKGKEAGPTIRKAIERAKLKIVEIKRGCGSWECGCGDSHTVPYKISGSSGSVSIELIPAPKGIGLVSGEIPRKILTLAGITDIWARTKGHTRTSFNFAYATFDALTNTNYVRFTDKDAEKLSIVSGAVENPGIVTEAVK